ncbi:MAG TPA: YceD family protein [Oxalicibacterium sp.]
MTAFAIDVFEFCRLGERREGEVSVVDLPRLAAECIDAHASLRWTLQGGANSFGHPQLTMMVAGNVRLVCQRCMTALEHEIASEQVLVLARNEEQADEIEELLGDESIDVIVGAKSMNILDLVEDEALLSLPLSSRHEVCPNGAVQDAAGNVRKPSPFDVLKGLKQ